MNKTASILTIIFSSLFIMLIIFDRGGAFGPRGDYGPGILERYSMMMGTILTLLLLAINLTIGIIHASKRLRLTIIMMSISNVGLAITPAVICSLAYYNQNGKWMDPLYTFGPINVVFGVCAVLSIISAAILSPRKT